MANEKTCGDFHEAKSNLEGALITFKLAGEKDSRELPEEIIDCVFDVFGNGFLEKLNAEISAM